MFIHSIIIDVRNISRTKNQSFEFQILNDFNYDLYFLCHNFGVPVFLVNVETAAQKIFYSSVKKLWCDEVNKTSDNLFMNTGHGCFIDSTQLHKASKMRFQLNLNTKNNNADNQKQGSLI